LFGGTFSTSASINVVASFSFILGHNVISELLILEGTYDLEDVLVSHESTENIFELFGTSARSTEKGATLGDSNQCRLKLLQNALEIIDYFFHFLRPSSNTLPHSVVHFSDDPDIIFLLFLADLFVFS
jgi:hypothetical protein